MMMEFKDFKYERLDYEDIKKTYSEYLDELEGKEDTHSFMEVFDKINKYRGHIQTMMTLASIRHSINTSDEFYDAENNYWDEKAPLIEIFEDRFASICLDFKLKDALPIPKTFMKLLENRRKCFKEDIIGELQEENRLSSEYNKLKASASLMLDGEVYNLASIGSLLSCDNRELRKKAFELVNDFYTENSAKFDDIYDKLVKVRDKIAKKLGYKDFVEVGYLRMNRLDYNETMVENYRKQIVDEIVPLVSELNRAQALRIGVPELKSYDVAYKFKSGNPKPIGDAEYLTNSALKMYQEMSPETKEYFEMMCNMKLFDLPTRPFKEMGGYCTDIFDYKVPFIFSNFNGTMGDVDVLTHEAGHGFQSYLSGKTISIPDICFPTMEACEIHSMSMEFFAHPWMELFFGKDTLKYYYYHIVSALTFLPYGCLVDHFQHEIYHHPEMSKEERKKCFRELEKIYKPDSDYEGYKLLEDGGFFYRQGHIFSSPFYYIDYCLAQVCALEFYNRSLNNDPNTWSDYVHLCKLGGTMSFVELVKEAGLISPFEDGCVSSIVTNMRKELEKIDDTNL